MVIRNDTMPDITRPINIDAPLITAGELDMNQALSIAMIRQHTKTDDVPSVTDEQLALYRDAAFEAAEQYTGMLFRRTQSISEPVAQKGFYGRDGWGVPRRNYVKHTLQYPASDGLVYIYGTGQGVNRSVIKIEPGTREVRVPLANLVIDVDQCCDPCRSGRGVNHGLMVMYKAGFSSAKQIPKGIILGVLKHIAWSIQNPGDELMTVRNSASTSETGLIGTNNVAWASGAIELWRQYVQDAY